MEITSIYGRTQKNYTDDEIRIRSKRLMIDNLIWQYGVFGYDEKIKRQYTMSKKNAFESVLSSLLYSKDSFAASSGE